MKKTGFTLRKRIKSFVYAFNGIKILIKEEHNARIHLVLTSCVVLSGFLFSISSLEWICIILCIGIVFSLELINTALENLADFISPEKHEQIKKAKDLSAAAVLIGAFTALVIGLIIFIPRFFYYLADLKALYL